MPLIRFIGQIVGFDRLQQPAVSAADQFVAAGGRVEEIWMSGLYNQG